MQQETTLSQKDIDERAAILRRLRQLLERQRDKFREYLAVLEQQEKAIHAGDADVIAAHTELEEHIISNIQVIRKVISPLEDMYQTLCPGTREPLPEIRDELSHLQEHVTEQNRKNRELLTSAMSEIRRQVVALKNPYAKKKSIYSSDTQSAGIIDIRQ